ncbi:hypothetical protein V6N11_021587 [Hibiscus sabdariffa]|uniref:Uncharacterized protein n=2 Tax=Hibiscus sabdariffa TaxID=183260 RepID=A0ABR1ZBB2_9ROSI
MLGFSKRVGVCSVLDSDMWGLYEGLLSTWSLHIHYLIAETDSLDAYRLITEPDVVCGGSTLLPHILELISRPWDVRVQHICRSSNGLADRMANLASPSDLLIHRYVDPPHVCRDIIVSEAAVSVG